MSDAAIMTLVSGAVTIATMVIGFLTLWVKAKYTGEQAEMAAHKATAVENKVDLVVKQTDGLAKALARESKAAGFAEGEKSEKAKNGPEYNGGQ